MVYPPTCQPNSYVVVRWISYKRSALCSVIISCQRMKCSQFLQSVPITVTVIKCLLYVNSTLFFFSWISATLFLINFRFIDSSVTGVGPLPDQLPIVAGVAMGSLVGGLLVVYSCQKAPPPLVAVVRSSEIILALFSDYVIFQTAKPEVSCKKRVR